MSVVQEISASIGSNDAVKAIIDELIADMLYLAADVIRPIAPKADPVEVARALRFAAGLLTVFNEGFFGSEASQPD